MMETSNMILSILDNEYYLRNGEILQRNLLEQKKATLSLLVEHFVLGGKKIIQTQKNVIFVTTNDLV